jgi:hypothetical protein
MCSRAAEKDLDGSSGSKTFQRKLQIEKKLQSKKIMPYNLSFSRLQIEKN